MRMAMLAGIGLITVAVNVAGYIFAVWLIASVMTSAIKSYNHDCGTKYGVEDHYVDGNFFCKK